MRNTGTMGTVRALVALTPIYLLGFTGCIAVGGSDSYTQPTLGKQLQDLKMAHDTKAINDQEYDDAKGRLLRGEYKR